MASPDSAPIIKTIEEWNKLQKHSAYYEIVNHEKYRQEGGLKSKPKENWQGPGVYTTQNAKSDFHKSITIALCAHGHGQQTPATPLSLIIWHFQLTCKGKKRFENATIGMTFKNHGTDEGPPPEVVNWQPFKKMEITDRTEVAITATSEKGGSVGGEFYAKLEASLRETEERTWQQRFFHKSWSHPIHLGNPSKRVGVLWNFDENRSQDYGINPDFHLAVLVKPTLDAAGKAKPFCVKLDMDLDAGTWNNIQDGVSRIFLAKEPILCFDPSRPLEWDDTGKRIKEEVNQNIGKLDTYEDDSAFMELLSKIETAPSKK